MKSKEEMQERINRIVQVIEESGDRRVIAFLDLIKNIDEIDKVTDQPISEKKIDQYLSIARETEDYTLEWLMLYQRAKQQQKQKKQNKQKDDLE